MKEKFDCLLNDIKIFDEEISLYKVRFADVLKLKLSLDEFDYLFKYLDDNNYVIDYENGYFNNPFYSLNAKNVDLVGLYFDEISNIPLLSKDEEYICFKLYNKTKSTELKQYIACHNLKLVVSRAKKFLDYGIPLLDLVQEGNIGLLKAIDRFDYTRGYKFSTAATLSIDHQIKYSFPVQHNSVVVPWRNYKECIDFKKKKENYEKEIGREAGNAELADALSLSISDIEDMMRVISIPVSLDEEFGDGYNKKTLKDDLVEDLSIEDKVVTKISFEEVMENVLEKLTEKEVLTILYRFGLYGNQCKTYREIGKILDVRYQYIQQLEKSALEKMRTYIDCDGVIKKNNKTKKR